MSVAVVNQIRSGCYLDSVALMRISAHIATAADVEEAALMMGSESNKQILQTAGLLAESGQQAGPNDLIIAIRVLSPDAAQTALTAAAAALDSQMVTQQAAHLWQPRSLDAALDIMADANLALISVPGEYAAWQAHRALQRDLNVMIFSDNVALEQELALKRKARERGLLVMGPDCGTALINGVPLAFANAIPQGPIGAIAASGTGLQEFSVLLARNGVGLAHGLGVGGRDLSDAIGGLSTLTAIEWLEQDPATEHIVLISKPPGRETSEHILRRLSQCTKPVTVCFIGYQAQAQYAMPIVTTLRAAAEQVLGRAIAVDLAALSVTQPDTGRRWLRGLFSGGTLCAEAQVVFSQAGLTLQSNTPIPGMWPLSTEPGHKLIDLGADEYTQGRPHPMLEPAVRNEILSQELQNPEVAMILLDVVLGYGAHTDPAGALAAAVTAAGESAAPAIASVCGVAGDPQDYRAQVSQLQAAGITVAPSNAHAAELALRALGRMA